MFKQCRRTAEEPIGFERSNLIVKSEAQVEIALVYPNTYAIGMASLGFQSVYRMFNEHPSVKCDRAFLDDSPNTHPRTLETHRELGRFDAVGFSLSFEMDIPNLLSILIKSGIPFLSHQRGDHDPLVLVGGVVAFLNPAPLFHFVDAFILGEADELIGPLADLLQRFKSKKASRDEKLQRLSELPGVLVPSTGKSAGRLICSPLPKAPQFTPIVTPQSHFKNLFVVEIARGCPRSCKFCAAQEAYHPFRFFPAESILETIQQNNPGAEAVGLEGAGFSDHPELLSMTKRLSESGLRVSFSSIRADRVTPELIKAVGLSGAKSFTVAPETGTETLRKRIGKTMSDRQLLDVTVLLRKHRIQLLKVYFMIGLPGETDGDIDAIQNLVMRLADRFESGRNGRRIRVSVNAFIPKAFTEFQFEAVASERDLRDKRRRIAEPLRRVPGVEVAPKSVREEMIQAWFALGGPEVGLAAVDVVQGHSWKDSMKRHGIDPDFIHLKRQKDDAPWKRILEYKSNV
jgi:radical SAM superfamily enzyme YgiQ (UPF0313 family)